MKKRKDIHFEVSERKVLLRIFDFFSVLFSLYFVGIIFQFDYFNISATNYYWTIVLGLYLLFFGSVFEMYNCNRPLLSTHTLAPISPLPIGIEPLGPLLCAFHVTLYGASFTCAIQAQGLKKNASTTMATHNPTTKFPFRISN